MNSTTPTLNTPHVPDVCPSPRYRLYVAFSREKIPFWTVLLRACLRRYQGSPVTYTHTFLIIDDTEQGEMHWIEMEWREGLQVYDVEYIECTYSVSTSTLQFTQCISDGEDDVITIDAIDITLHSSIMMLQAKLLPEISCLPITPCTLLTHMIPNANKITWTCSGIVSYLVGVQSRTEAFLRPLTPDQLRAMLRSLID